MTDRAIRQNQHEVRALLAGTRTQMRRVIKPRCHCSLFDGTWTDSYVLDPGNQSWRERDLSFAVGDRLWVKETWGYDWFDDGNSRAWKKIVYRADDGSSPSDNGDPAPWRPSIHMPRWASRLTLTATDVRVQRLADISEEDALAEGVKRIATIGGTGWQDYSTPDGVGFGSARLSFRSLWNHINGPDAWTANPFVMAVSFSVQRGNIDSLARAA